MGSRPKSLRGLSVFSAFLGEITKSPEQAGSEETALNCGYYDQSHMLKDFRAFAGTTPEKYKKYLAAKDRSKNLAAGKIELRV
ncbi:MAG: hypothetical protein ACLTZM_14835 [Ruminococcus sp.]